MDSGMNFYRKDPIFYRKDPDNYFLTGKNAFVGFWWNVQNSLTDIDEDLNLWSWIVPMKLIYQFLRCPWAIVAT